MSTVLYIVLATIVGIGVAALFVGVEEFPDIDSVGCDETDEHEDLTR